MRVKIQQFAPPGAVFTANAVADMASGRQPVTNETGREVGHVVDAELGEDTTMVILTLEITDERMMRALIARTPPWALSPWSDSPEECDERPRRDAP